MDDIKFEDAGDAPSPPSVAIVRPDGSVLREVGPESESRGGADAERDPDLPDDLAPP